MFKIYFCIIGLVLTHVAGFSQATPNDTLPARNDLAIDTSINYDEWLDEFDSFLDSLLAPRSYFLAAISAGNGYFNYTRGSSAELQTVRRNVYSPILGYYHKSGPGLTVAANMTNDGERFGFYQYMVSPSFDFIQSTKWIGGLSYQRYFARETVPFYISPLQNEFNAYFLWRKSWLQPGLTASYGWGSRTEYQKRERYIQLLLLRHLGYVVSSSSKENISDFSLSASVRHSFYWMYLLGENDYLKFTPQLSLSAGTQRFGFNRTSNSYSVKVRRDTYVLYNSGDVNLDEKLKFQPLSLTLYLRPEYNFGKLFIQPQFLLDYYWPAQNLAALFSINAGVIL